VALASDVVVIRGAALTVIESDWVAVTPSASVTLTTNVCVEALLETVPLMVPDELRVSPLGNDPDESDHV
jgi:hypothetical protein